MNDAYVKGFMDKCAALGVDPENLVKLSGAWEDQMAAFKAEQSKPENVAKTKAQASIRNKIDAAAGTGKDTSKLQRQFASTGGRFKK